LTNSQPYFATGITAETFEDLIPQLDEIIANNVRILFFYSYIQEVLIKSAEYLYDKGFRPGDFVFIIDGRLPPVINVLREARPDYYRKVS
jgi:hypothetical protein